jgi:urea transport system permease protein
MLVQYVSPTSLELSLSASAVVWAAVGGRMSLLGAIIGAFLVNGIQSYLGDELQQVWMITLGVIFIAVVLFLPRGLVGLVESLLGNLTGGRQAVKLGKDAKESA